MPMRRARRSWVERALLAGTIVASCGSSACESSPDTVKISLVFTPGQERDAWDRDPMPAHITVKAAKLAAETTTVADAAWPVSDLSMGTLGIDETYSFAVEVRDAAGDVVMRGATPMISTDEAASSDLPLLCGRVGELARAGTTLSLPWPAPMAALVDGRYALLLNGTTASELFDFAYLFPLETSTPLAVSPRAALGLPGGGALFVSDSGFSAYSLDTGDAGSVSVAIDPQTLAGASSVLGDDGSAYLVGATRDGSPSSAVLRVDANGLVTALSLPTPRTLATATWSHTRGLIVIGGADTDTVDVLAPGGTAFVAQQAGVPALRGGAAISLTDDEALVAGALDSQGTALPVLRVNLACAPSCGPAQVAADPIDLPRGTAFSAGSSHALLVGAAASGATTAVLLTESAGTVTTKAVPLRAPRKNAAAISLGDGRVAILGGADDLGAAVLSVEIFTPP